MQKYYLSQFFKHKIAALVLTLIFASTTLTGEINAQSADSKAEDLVNSFCSACHKTGAAGAPVLGDKEQWADRLPKGTEKLVSNALNGINAMPPKGGNATLDDEIVKDAVLYMIDLVGNKTVNAASPSPDKTDTSDEKSPVEVSPISNTTQTVQAAATQKKATVAPENTFNRLIKPVNERNRPPAEDGIHDPSNPATALLQSPGDAFTDLPRSQSGNYIDWGKALNDGHITPRFDALDPDVKPTVLDMNIVREVKGSMPDVVYPHKAHTEWLDCSNCHPALFEPRKGANQISMAAILLGEKCGVCHGKVAFPIAECRRCHSQKKQPAAQNVSE